MKNKSLLGLATGMLLFGMVVQTNAQTYCEPELDCTDDDLISNVTFGAINNTTACSPNGYGNYRALPSATVAISQSYPISVTVGEGWEYESVSVWIDYNQNGVFEASEFTFIGTGSGSVVSGNISIPATALPGNTVMRVRVAADAEEGATSDLSCDEDQGYGETEDYTVNITGGVSCAGTPDAGLASASVTGVCPSISFNLTSNLTPEGGLSYQWQSSTDGGTTWNNLGTAQTGASYTVASGITQNTQYRVIVTCTNSSESDTSNVVSVTVNPANSCYCQPTSNCTETDEITNVTFAGINQNSTCTGNGYNDFTSSTPASVTAGGTYPISVTIPPHIGSEHVAAWIDYNQNGVFEASEFTFIGTSPAAGSVVTSNIEIPVTALGGQTRIRIRARFSTLLTGADACLIYTYGETEDYLVDITPAAACVGTPDAGTASSSVNSVCVGTNINLTSDVTPEAGFSFQWQSSTDGGTTWTNLGAAQTNANYTTTQTQATNYRLIVTCTNSSESDTSNTVSVAQTPVANCLCQPELDCTDGDLITNVTFGTINNTTTCSPNGYGDYRALPAPSISGSLTYPISVTVGAGFTNESVSVWIDYNNNGIFEANEFTYIGTGSGSVVTGSINIPATANAGATTMRVRVAAVGATSATNDKACDEAQGYGETEDYTVNIIAATACAGTPDAGTASASQTAVCANTSISLSSNNTQEAGLSYQWQSSTDGGTTWSNLGSSQAVSGYSTTQSQTTQYRLIVTCTNSSESDTSNAVSVTQNAPSTCYCTPTIPFVCNDGDLITNVTFGSINNNSGCATGYSDYSTSVAPAVVLAGATVPISVSVGPSGDGWLYESVGVWIDFNQNGVLDSLENEYTPVGTGLNQAVTGNIVIPANALLGTTRMRVVVTASQSPLNSAVCGPLTTNNPYGEMEDYSITITDVAPVIDSVVVATQGGVAASITTQGGTLPLVATVYPSTQAQTVTWSIVPVTGSATISASGVVTATTNGTVWGKAVSTVDVTKSDSILITITGQTVGIEDISTNIDFTVFPNPTSESITLQSSANHAVLQMQMLDVTGRVLSNRMVQANELNGGILVDLSTFAPGTYFVTLTGQNVRITKTVIRK